MDTRQMNTPGSSEQHVSSFFKITIGVVIITAIIVGIAAITTIFFELRKESMINPGETNGAVSSVESGKIKNETTINTNNQYTASLYKGNYIRGGAMSLAWNELVDNITKEPLRLQTSDDGMKITEIFNAKYFTKKDLDEASYYVKSGFGKEIVEEINRDSKAKFPQKSFDDLSIDGVQMSDIISYAYFFKKLAYKEIFEKNEMVFNGSEKVESFIPDKNYGIIENIKYWNDEKFIVAIQLKDAEDEIFLAKGFDMDNGSDVVDVLREELATSKRKPLNSEETYDDSFEAPMIQVDMKREYKELMGSVILNTINDETNYKIGKMFENIKFEMDEVGVKVENEGVMMMTFDGITMEEEKIERKFFLNQPYWIIMKRKNSNNPYFLLGVNNTEIMKKK